MPKTNNRRPPRITPLRTPARVISYTAATKSLYGANLYRTALTRHQLTSLPQSRLQQAHHALEKETRRQHLRLSIQKAKRVKMLAPNADKALMGGTPVNQYAEKFTAAKSAIAVNSRGALSGGVRPLGPSLFLRSSAETRSLNKKVALAQKSMQSLQTASRATIKDKVAKSALRTPTNRDFTHSPSLSSNPNRTRTPNRSSSNRNSSNRYSPNRDSTSDRYSSLNPNRLLPLARTPKLDYTIPPDRSSQSNPKHDSARDPNRDPNRDQPRDSIRARIRRRKDRLPDGSLKVAEKDI